MCESCRDLIKAIDAYIEKADKKLGDQLKAKGYIKPEKTLEYAESIEEGVAEVLSEETDEIVQALNRSDSVSNFYKIHWPKFKESDGLTAKLSTIFRENFKNLIPEFVGYYIDEIDAGLSKKLCSKRTVAWVESWSGELGRMMKLNDVAELEGILTKALKDGRSVPEVTLQIMESGIRNPYYRARRVAVTEMLRAHSVAAQEAQMQSPSVGKKMWLHTGAHKNEPRWNHVAMSGQIVNVDEPYELTGADGGTYYPMYPRDGSLPASESVNCHCISQPIVDEDVLGLSLDERLRLQNEAIERMDDEWEQHLREEGRGGPLGLPPYDEI